MEKHAGDFTEKSYPFLELNFYCKDICNFKVFYLDKKLKPKSVYRIDGFSMQHDLILKHLISIKKIKLLLIELNLIITGGRGNCIAHTIVCDHVGDIFKGKYKITREMIIEHLNDNITKQAELYPNYFKGIY